MKAKQLQWEIWEPFSDSYKANVLHMTYTILYFSGEFIVEYEIYDEDSEEFIVEYEIYDKKRIISHCETLEEAKQAAQEHFQQLWESITCTG